MSDGLRTYGIKERLAELDVAGTHAQEIQLVGYSVVEGVVAVEELQRWRDRVDALLLRQTEEGGGVEAMCALGENNTARALLAYDDAFLDLALRSQILEICERLLGDYFILNQQNAVVNPPAGQGHHQSAYHRDLPYQHFVASRPLALSALVCIDAFTAETGGTVVLPGSHKLEGFPSDVVASRSERVLSAPAGACLVFDSMLFHRSGLNTTALARRAVNHVWTLPILKQQIALPGLIRPELIRDARIARLLGCDSEPAKSVADWISRRRARARG
jgi:ectoine hydroxylase-related dioxygenase (phytanoyl-CoA dioxygenase family)